MKIHLLPEHEASVREKVESGEYESANDVITDALFCFQHIDPRAAARGAAPRDPDRLEEADEVVDRIEQKLRVVHGRAISTASSDQGGNVT